MLIAIGRVSERKTKIYEQGAQMSIQKKSLISTLKTAKKANVASTSAHDGEAKGSKVSSMRLTFKNGFSMKTMKSTKKI
jgi:hypothetical protein